MNSSIKFDCPKCGADQHAYLNTSAQRRKGENEKTCDRCGSRIIIDITIYTAEYEDDLDLPAPGNRRMKQNIAHGDTKL